MKQNIFLHNLRSSGWQCLFFPQKHRKNQGFTLIEVIVSLAIIGVGIVAVLQLFSGGLRSIKVSDDYLRAAILAQNKMKELEIKYSYFKSDEGGFEEDERYHWSLKVEDYDLTELYPQFESNEDEKKSSLFLADKVTLEVFWKTEHGQRKMEIVTIKTLTRVNPASSKILQGNYPAGLKRPRGYQFGEQDLPLGQSGKEYEKIYGISGGLPFVREKQTSRISGSSTGTPGFNISGSSTGTETPHISGSSNEPEYPTNISGN